MTTSPSKKTPSDLGSERLGNHKNIKIEIADLSNTSRARVVDESTADWLLLRGHLSVPEYDLVTRLKSDIHLAGLSGIRASDYQPRVTSGNNQNISSEQAVKRLILNDIIKHLDRKIGAHPRRILIDMCLDIWDIHGPDMPPLKRAIEELERFYGQV